MEKGERRLNIGDDSHWFKTVSYEETLVSIRTDIYKVGYSPETELFDKDRHNKVGNYVNT